jgi:hypothetical protein
MTLHLGYPTLTQGHQLTSLTLVARTKQGSQVSLLWLNQTELTGLTPVANQNPALDQTQTNHTPLIIWKVHVARDREHGYHDSLRLHNFTHRLVISSLAKWLKVSILPNV